MVDKKGTWKVDFAEGSWEWMFYEFAKAQSDPDSLQLAARAIAYIQKSSPAWQEMFTHFPKALMCILAAVYVDGYRNSRSEKLGDFTAVERSL